VLLVDVLTHLRATCADKAAGYTVAISATVAPATAAAAAATSASATRIVAEEHVLHRPKLVNSTAAVGQRLADLY
jgi:hypothetical protein